ncbi:DUF4238 domain-containing protein [Megalodesulfovibrio gigas]|uniref:DUF4238 domain-containing protein n=1 Tax=Megalodesulfovibrio gigas TaxID=879 RepID=UPI00130E2D82|nr:DUF4238 domain-containing protein [Megalodesulfovibrio gigas]
MQRCKNQHYLPCFLMRGFLTNNAQKKGELTHAFFKDDKYSFRHARSIRSIGHDEFFYDTEEKSADEHITRLENTWATQLDNARKTASIATDDIQWISSFISHLVMRTENTRNTFRDMQQNVATEADKHLNNMQSITEITNLYLAESEKMREIKRLLSILQKSKVTSKKKIPTAHQLASTMAQHIHKQFQPIFQSMPTEINNSTKSAHIDALTTDPDTLGRTQQYRNMFWTIRNYTADTLILGDIGPVAIEQHGNHTLAVLCSQPSVILLPISSKSLLLGTKETLPPNFSPEEINAMSASLSSNFFIAASVTPENEALRTHINSKRTVHITSSFNKAVATSPFSTSSIISIMKTQKKRR